MESKKNWENYQHSIFVSSIENVKPEELKTVLGEVMRVEEEAWPPEVRATIDKFESRYKVFPQGFLLAEVEGYGLMGVSTSEIISFDFQNPPTSWEKITDNGYIRKTHNMLGNALYVVSIGVSRRVESLKIKGVGTRLIKAQKELALKLGLGIVVLGARVSGYGRYLKENPDISVENYLEIRRDDGQRIDDEIRFYERNGFRILDIVPNYMENDPESANYGVVMVWENKF